MWRGRWKWRRASGVFGLTKEACVPTRVPHTCPKQLAVGFVMAIIVMTVGFTVKLLAP